MSEYKWNGQPAAVEFGSCLVRTNEENPLWWYNFECYPSGKAHIPTLRITIEHGSRVCFTSNTFIGKEKMYTFMISNHFGIGVHKLLNGGWIEYTEFSIEGSFSTNIAARITKFDLEGYEAHEAERAKWQQRNHPEEWAKKQALRYTIRKGAFKGY